MKKEIKEMKKNSVTHIYNLGLKREDGKVERDTIYREEKKFTEKEVEELGVRFSCDVILEYVGTVNYASLKEVKASSFIYKLPDPVKDESVVLLDEKKDPEKKEDIDGK